MVEWIHLSHCKEGIMRFLLKCKLGELSECETLSVDALIMRTENTAQNKYTRSQEQTQGLSDIIK